jgi:hypothetical protein
MAGTLRASRRASRRSKRTHLDLLILDERIVPSYFPSTTNGIHVFQDQLPTGMPAALVQFLATHTDGTQKQTANAINAFRAVNPNYTLLHYQLGSGNSPYNYIINNSWSSDWSYVNGQEDWFAHQSYSGEPQSATDLSSGRVGNSTGWDQADITNTNWQQYTLNQVFQNMAATGSTGWFADSFTYGVGGAGYNNPIPTRYQGTNAANTAAWPGGITWTTQLSNWAQVIENAFTQHNATYGTNYQFIPNLDALVTTWEPTWYLNSSGVPIMDGAFLENFGQYSNTSDWTLAMNRALKFTDNNKIVIMQPYLQDTPDSTTGQQERNFYMGTYLLLKGSETYVDIEYGSSPQYFPEYQINLGTAVTPLATNVSSYLWNGVYRRNFQNGFVLVNPGSTTYTLNLGGTYQLVQGHGGGDLTAAQLDASGNYIGGSLTYQNLSSISLAGGSAAIFLNPSLTVATPAAAAVNPITGTSVSLNVLGQENGSDTGLTYTWSSSGPAAVNFSDNGDNAAKNVLASFTQPGSYTLTATITDASHQSVTSSVIVTVNQTLTTIAITPSAATLAAANFQLFTATASDQFGLPISGAAITWSLTGPGTLSPIGLYTAPTQITSSAAVTASSDSVSSSVAVTVVPGPAVKLAFGLQPVGTATGVTLPPVTVQVLDVYGNLETSDNTDVVTIGVASGPGPFSGGSTTTAKVTSGVATFSNLTLVTPGNYTLSELVPGLFTGPFSTPITIAPLQVLPGSFVGTPSGFSLQFNAPFLVNSVSLVLYGQGFGASAPVPSVTLTQTKDSSGRAVNVPISGSLVLNTASNTVTFVATNTVLEATNGSPVMPDGSYLVTVHSNQATDGFQAQNSGGGFLDGAGTGIAGSGDYTATLTVNAAAANNDVIWVPATADGPGQPLSAPGNNQIGGGYPVYLNDSTGAVSNVQVTINYDPALLSITAVTGASFSLLGSSMPGHAALQYSGPALPAGKQIPVGYITATVPGGTAGSPMPYKAKDLLHLTGVSINGGTIPVTTSDALHLVAYVGDADGNGAYGSGDAVLITRAALQTDSGFSAYPLVDPAIVADTDGSGFIPADAALQVNEAGVGFPTANLPNPPIPSGVVFQPTAAALVHAPALQVAGAVQQSSLALSVGLFGNVNAAGGSGDNVQQGVLALEANHLAEQNAVGHDAVNNDLSVAGGQVGVPQGLPGINDQRLAATDDVVDHTGALDDNADIQIVAEANTRSRRHPRHHA